MTKFYDDATVEHVAERIYEIAKMGEVVSNMNLARAALDALATTPGWRIQYAVSLTDTPEPYLTHNREDAEVLRGDMETKGIIASLVGPWMEVGGDD